MSRSKTFLTNFRGGVLSDNALGLVNTEMYKAGLSTGLNVTVETLGGISRRAGSVFIRDYGAIDYVRVFPFSFNREQAYVVVMKLIDATRTLTGSIDIYKHDTLVASDIVSPYNTIEAIKGVEFAQSADAMILSESSVQPYMLRRLGSDSSWDMIPVPIVNPPLYDPAQTGTPDTPMWSDTLGYPKFCTFHQSRLWFASSNSFPQNLWSSVSQDFFNFDLGAGDPADSIQEALDTDFINPITAIFSARQLQVFTGGAEFVNDAQVITPTTSAWARQSDYGSTSVQPVTVDGATMFVDSSGRTIRNFTYALERGGYDSPSISIQAEHLIKEPQKMGVLRGSGNQPANFVFVINIDGTIALLNISRSHDLLAWTEWTTQGQYKDIIIIDKTAYILVQRYVLATDGEYVTHLGERVTYNTDDVYIGDNPISDVKLSWMLERVSNEMYVDSGSFTKNITDVSLEDVGKARNRFFGVYYTPDMKQGKTVIIQGGEVIHIDEFLSDTPLETFTNTEGNRYRAGTIFSYDDNIRAKYFTQETGYIWYMYTMFDEGTLDDGKNYIEGLSHLIGSEVVSTLDGNIQEARIVEEGSAIIDGVAKIYPDGTGWRYDNNNELLETSGDNRIIYTKVVYDGIEYINPSPTPYGYLIQGKVGEVGSVYIQKGTVKSVETVKGRFLMKSSAPLDIPFGINHADICIVAGGGSGSGMYSDYGFSAGGGFAGESWKGRVPIPEGTTIQVTIGAGGISVTGMSDGRNGALSQFYTKQVVGGNKGVANSSNYAGNGATRSGVCNVTNKYTDGKKGTLINTSSWGGQASGLANGGDGRWEDGQDGTIGSGGGGNMFYNVSPKSGKGGDGQCDVDLGYHSISQIKSRVRKVELEYAIITDGAISYPLTTFENGQAGLFFPVIAVTMPINVASQEGSHVNDPKRIVSVTSRFIDTQGVSVNGIQIPERVFGQKTLDRPPKLVSGIVKNWHVGYTRDTSVIITQNDPMPFSLLSLDIEINY